MKLPGWKHVGGSVWEHESGARAHPYGMLWLPDGEYVIGCWWPLSKDLDRYIRICGGNRRRGTLAWATSVIEQHKGE